MKSSSQFQKYIYQKAWKEYITVVWLLCPIFLKIKKKNTSDDSDKGLDAVLIDQDFANSNGTVKS